jgi:hypothetical protein
VTVQRVVAAKALQEKDMASFRAHLSPNEETTLRRIAMGTLESKTFAKLTSNG